MARRIVAPKAPAFVDVCPRHGLWFDPGEFEAFREFVARGGLEIARRRREVDARRSHRRVFLIADDDPPHPFFH
jgi:hypothetical protein